MPQIQVTTIGITSQPNEVTEIENLKSRLQKTWMAGDYDRFSRYMEDGARQYYERLEIPPRRQVIGHRMWLGPAGAHGITRRFQYNRRRYR